MKIRTACDVFLGFFLCYCGPNVAGSLDLPLCPTGWLTLDHHCYWFERGAISNWKEALSSCKTTGARLVSPRTDTEAHKISEHLKHFDINRQTWLTSGVSTDDGAWEWQGDGTQVKYSFWQNNFIPTHTSGPVYIAFGFAKSQYKWVPVNETDRLPYICEVSRLSLWQVYHKNRPPEFMGLSAEKVFEKPKHPVLIEQPENVVYFGEEGPKKIITLKCRATGHPQPVVKWYKGSGGAMVDLSGNSRMIQADGSLIFLNVSSEDFDSYHCIASNSLGSVRSRRIVLNHAYTREFPESRLNVYATAGLGRSISCEEPDHFPQSLGYGWMYDSVKKFVRETERIYISLYDGSLYFSYLKAEDQRSYSCNIINSELQTGHYGPFFQLQISQAEAGVASQFNPIIPEEFLKIYPKDPQLGQPVWLECFAYGRPSPTYVWRKSAGSSLPVGSYLRNYGRNLYIPSFSVDDAGTYQCTAANSLGSTTKKISLNFRSRPVFLSELKDQFVEPGGTAFFNCDAFGRPSVEYEWFRQNGPVVTPISPLLLPPEDYRRITVNNSQLTITNLQTKDSGVYQCIASNLLGQEVSTGYLAVRNFPPVSSKEVARKTVHTFKGDSVEISCNVEASPKPNVFWRKNGYPMKYGKGYTLLANGRLKIAKATLGDSAEYSCTATNDYGSDSSSVVLTVTEKLGIEMSENLQLRPGENHTLYCSAKNGCDSPADFYRCSELVYSWSFNGEPISNLPQFQSGYFVNHHDKSLFPFTTTVKNAYSGTYMCRIDSAAGHVSGTVNVEVLTPPLSPIRIKVHTPRDYLHTAPSF